MRDKKTATQTSAWMATICKILLFVSYEEGVLNWLNSEVRSASEGAPMARVLVRLFVGREAETGLGGSRVRAVSPCGFGEELVWSCYDQRSPRTLARYAPVCCTATRRLGPVLSFAEAKWRICIYYSQLARAKSTGKLSVTSLHIWVILQIHS